MGLTFICRAFFTIIHAQPLPPTHKQGWTRVSRIFLEFQLFIGMSLNNLAAIASRTSLLASSTFMSGLYLDLCQTLIIGGEGELQVIFKRLHFFMRTSRNDRKLRKLLHCPKDFFQDCRNLRYTRISMLWSNGSCQNRESTDHYHMTVWRAQSLTH